MPGILADAEANLSGALRFLLAQLSVELEQTSQSIREADAAIQTTVRENEACRRLVGIPGIGPVTATAVIAAIGNGGAFRKGRELAAWVGVVPRQRSTGGKPTLLGISKRGNAYLRRLFVQGARAVLQQKASQMVGQAVSHYRVVEKLAEGGMGVVYKAEDLSLAARSPLSFFALTRSKAGSIRNVSCARPRPRHHSITRTSAPSTKSTKSTTPLRWSSRKDQA